MYEIFEHLLQELGISVYKVSKDTGIAQSTLSSWKSKNNKIGSDNAEILARYFGVSIDYLMGREKDGGEEKKYYLDDETIDRLQSLKVNNKLRILFDASRKLQPGDIDYVLDLVNRLSEKDQ